ncbi:MAG: hypothetical protein JKY42_05615 [Flavobacteriales bacterium]|nr:hypothetical protein [Flavobacteriales bacterium]
MSKNSSSSILLNSQSDGNRVNLSWSKYQEWNKGVEKYIIEKQINDREWKLLKEVPGSENQIFDVIYE